MRCYDPCFEVVLVGKIKNFLAVANLKPFVALCVDGYCAFAAWGLVVNLVSRSHHFDCDDYYQMVEIEFYWYSPNHPDLSVYPRRSKAGNWFLHPSGVDITLESCVEEDISMLQLRKDWENAKKNQENQNVVYSKYSYGGILIRSMHKFKPTNDPTNSASFILGPWNCCDALFDYIPCDGNFKDINTMLPEITYYDKVEMMPDLDKKMENIEGNLICEAKRNGISEKHSVQYKDAHYCFYINPDYLTGWKSSSYSNKPWYKKRQ